MIELLDKNGTVVGELLPETMVMGVSKSATEMESQIAPIDGRFKFASVRCTLTPDTSKGFPNGVSIGLTQ